MKFPPFDRSLEPTEAQLLQFMHADTRQIYEMGDMSARQRQQLRDGEVARWKAAQKPLSVELITYFDSYTVKAQLGQGGAGYVYRAINPSGSEFAVKLLDPRNANEERRKRFRNELTFCENNKHRNIIKVVDRGVYEGIPFYVMPLFGMSLRKLLDHGIPVDQVLPLFSQILDGVEAAHLKRVTHRDLKPENILYDPTQELAVIADFGIAHFEEEDLFTLVETKPNTRLANFLYAAPEQRLRGQNVDQRADIFALGLILNELFTGEVAHGTGYKTIGSVTREYSYLDEIVATMIRSSPDERPENVEFLKKLLRTRADEFFTRQRLSELENAVIPASELDDPLIVDPPKLIDFKWQQGKLTLVLSKPVNDRWVQSMLTMGSHTSVWMKGPEQFSVRGNEASIGASENEVQRIIDYFKEWIPLITRRYETVLQGEQADADRRERQRLQAESEELERQLRLRRNIKI